MIWIVTLCLLFVAAWLFFNAMNEREWVQTHIHDELVAADKGLFPGLTGALSSLGEGDGKMSETLGKAVDTVREKSAIAGDKAKDVAARAADKAKVAADAAAEKTRETVDKVGNKNS